MTTRVVLALLFGFAVAHPAGATQPAGADLTSNWSPYAGCWQLADAAAPPAADICVVRLPDGAVKITTSSSGQPTFEQIIVADGVNRPVTEQECHGAQRITWSRSGRHLFARTELTCSDGTRRIVGGLSTIAADGAWVDAQSIDVDGHESIAIRAYRRPSDTRSSQAAFTADDIIDAHQQLSTRLLEAAIVHLRPKVALDARALRTLDKADVAPTVIDAIVAVSFPSHFDVQSAGSYVRRTISDAPAFANSNDPQAWAHVYSPFDWCYWTTWDPRVDRDDTDRSAERIDVRRTTPANNVVRPTGDDYSSPTDDTAVERPSETPTVPEPAPTSAVPRVESNPGHARRPPAATPASKGTVTKQGYTRRPPPR